MAMALEGFKVDQGSSQTANRGIEAQYGAEKKDNFGLDADLAAKMAEKYDVEQEKNVSNWIEAISGISKGDVTAAEWLHDGVVLCELANKIQPGAVKKINQTKMVFKQRENITFFQNFCRDHGVAEISLFGTDDLFDAKNMGSVWNCIENLGGQLQVKYPSLEPKLGAAINSEVQDAKRETGPATQSGGLHGAMEVQKLTQGMRQVAGGQAGVKDGTVYSADAAGIDKDLAEKKAAKYDAQLEAEVVEWIECVTGESKAGSMHEWLKSGQVLCRLANKITPGAIPSINTMATAFKERENITFFQKAMRDAGVPESQLFGTDDLYEQNDLGTFVRSVVNYGGAVQQVRGYSFAKLGAAVSHGMAGDAKRNSGPCTSQYEAMEKNMEVERPKNIGIIRG